MGIRYKDYYEILGVDRGATAEQIRKAFRDLARRYHPDVSKESNAAERFKEINEAYEVLKDPEKRQRYDSLGAGWHEGQEFSPPPGFENVRFDFGGGSGGPGDFSEFFSAIFGDAGFGDVFGGRGGPRMRTRAQPRAQRGEDAEAELTLTLAELAAGGKKAITLRAADGRTRDYQVTIPPGTTQGTRIRLAGQGHEGLGGGAAGDLFLRVRVEPDRRFELEGTDLRTTVRVAPWEAVLGAKVDVPTLTGTVTLSVPAGTQSGQILRARGQGLPRDEDHKGDLLVQVKVVVPTDPGDEEKRLFEELAKQSRFRPRG
jgi:curved DNA-binding protein